ncbi:MAG TPA: phosphogluconate dehydratase [Thermoanaerobaculia bacterium]|nr:phosphogluconate dehydratase [Thermoanaerobaculia bacterium]
MTQHHPSLHAAVARVTDRVRERSRSDRAAYLERVGEAAGRGPRRSTLACSNLAHSFAACALDEKTSLRDGSARRLAIVTAYNDMLSAHQPLETYPAEIRAAAAAVGAVAQVAGGVPAMCDGVTQGEAGMELSLFSRDLIAMATGVALSHDVYDAAVCLGVCDKIVPGLLIGALAFGHLPFVFMPAGPMPSGLPNRDKARIRQLYAEGKVSREQLLEAESRSYHSPGTCTFFGTANSNQLFMELIGLHLPGASFENPGTPLRRALTAASAQRAVALARGGAEYTPIAEVIDERALVNAVVGLLATGGSTNHTLHLVAVGHAAGLTLEWEDLDELSGAVPLLSRIYPSGAADVNDFHRAGGIAFLVGELLRGGLVHSGVRTVAGGSGLEPYRRPAQLVDGTLAWGDVVTASSDRDVLRPIDDPFQSSGGLRLALGNLGRAIVKVSAVDPARHRVEAPALVFDDQQSLRDAFERGGLDRDFVAVVRFQGPRANGMPELHGLMPLLGVQQDRGRRVALVTDGRLSGASGKVLAALHVCPEAAADGPLARVRNGDTIVIDAEAGRLEALVNEEDWRRREPARPSAASDFGCGRELFTVFRRTVGSADRGGSSLG